MTNKENKELEIFKEFAITAGLDADLGTAETRRPPEPDVRCKISGQSRAFELTEVVDPVRKRARVVMMKNLQDFWKRVEDLPPEHALIRDFSDAGFQVTFRDDATESACQKAGAALIDHLTQPHTILKIAGREYVQIPEKKPLNAIQNVVITRDYPNGPVITASSGGFFDIPIVDVVATKFAKTYTTGAEIDLLVYFDTYRALGEESWRPKFQALIDSDKVNSPFKRVWVFDRKGDRLIDQF